MSRESLTLFELNSQLKSIVKEHAAPSYWVVAEISELKVNYSGHCYLALIQKEEVGEQIVASSRATIWAQNFNMIKAYFETTTGQSLTEGLKILVKAKVEFHELYGLSLNIIDIEPSFTVGEMAVRKQKIIDQLIQEGVIDMNKELHLPELCQRIAVISSATAAGYEDFVEQLESNTYAYKFYHKLFPAVMQGDAAEQSIIEALDKIYANESLFDAVVIIRGGGGKADLNCFNSYNLAYHITQFPIPVLTGIGHEQDDTITDLVAHTRLKTPTAVATFFIEAMAELEYDLNEIAKHIIELTRLELQTAKESLSQTTYALQFNLKELLARNKSALLKFGNFLTSSLQQRVQLASHRVDGHKIRLGIHIQRKLKSEMNEVDGIQHSLKLGVQHTVKHISEALHYAAGKLRMLDPAKILERGYSITMLNGQVVRDSKLVNTGDEVETRLWKGKLKSKINDIQDERKKN